MLHPYLYFSKADVERFRERMARESDLRRKYKDAVRKSETLLSEKFVTEAQANGRNTQSQHADFGSVSGQANRMCFVLGLKYIVENDERCAEKLRELLLHFTGFERWFSHNYAVRKPVPWHSDLCSTATTLALADIFDLIYDTLSPQERKSIATAILDKGVFPALGDWVLPEKRIHALDSMGHNWWSVCISEAACAFLVLRDFAPEGERERIPALVDEALAEYLTYPGNRLFNKNANFDREGLFYESAGYNNFGTGSLLRYLWCSERYFGKNETIRRALPAQMGDAMMKFSYPCTRDGKLFYEFLSFGDQSEGATIDFFTKFSVLTGVASSALCACAATYGSDIRDRIIGYESEKLSGSVSSLPKNALYSSGFAVSRSCWEPDATLFAVKSGFCWNHSHNDSGSFVIYHQGKPFFIDSGRCNYDLPLYHAYYCQDAAHSVIRLGGKGRRDEELYRGTRFSGALTDSAEGKDFFFVQADSTGPMAHLCSRLYRNFFWLDDRLLVIFDEIYCHEEESVQFTLHFNGSYEETDGGIDFRYEQLQARLVSHEPSKMLLTQKQGHTDSRPDEDTLYIELDTGDKKRTWLLLHTLSLAPEDHIFTELQSENARGIRVESKDRVREIWFNAQADGHVMHDNSNNVIAGFETDAYMLMLTKDKHEGVTRVLMVCGSFLRRDGKALLSSFTKLTKEINLL